MVRSRIITGDRFVFLRCRAQQLLDEGYVIEAMRLLSVIDREQTRNNRRALTPKETMSK